MADGGGGGGAGCAGLGTAVWPDELLEAVEFT